MNIIIAGCGKVGQKLAQQLNNDEHHDITVIDLKYSIVQDIVNRNDIMGIAGSCTNADILIEAGINKADILIAVTGSDEINLIACLIAKKIAGCQTIARVRKPEYNKNLHVFKEDLGLAMVINPEQAAAAEMARILRFPSAIQIDTFAKGRIEILKFKIPDDSILNNMPVADIRTKLDCDILVCGIERQDDAFIPDGSFILKENDYMSFVASPQNASQFFKKIGIKTNSVKDTMIIGGGDTAYYLAKNLMQTGIKVKIIEQNENRCNELCELLPKASIICADGTDNQILTEEGLEYAQSLVALTNIDEENIILSLFAKSQMSGKIITKINRIAYQNVINTLDLGTIIHPKNITAEHIVNFVRAKVNSIGSNIETMHIILDGKAEALEFKITENSPIINKSLQELPIKKNVLIACINRNGKVFSPRGQDVILPNDTVIVTTSISGFNDIGDILN